MIWSGGVISVKLGSLWHDNSPAYSQIF